MATAPHEDTPTPGPWKIGETSITACAGYCTVLRIENGSLVIDKPQDARLIEAASELYEALQAVVASSPIDDDALGLALDALNKAEGKAA